MRWSHVFFPIYYGVAAVFKFQVFNSISTIPRLADMSSAPPKQLATPEDTFTALAAQFNFDNRIKDKILELGIRTLAEFRHYPRTDEEVKKLFVDSLTPSLDDIPARLQAARLRFAWNSCKAMLDAEHTRGRHIALIGLLMMFIGWPDPTFMECPFHTYRPM